MSINFTRYLLFLSVIFALFWQSCANPGTPTGGYKDVRKPRIRYSNPKNQSLYVKENKIVIQFDETVRLKNIKANLAIIPNTDNEYEYTHKKNKLTIQFKKELLPNTTYVLVFDDVIEDITEGNKGANMRIAFSTGGTIDSLSMRGVVRDIFTNKVEKEAIVMLYNALDTFSVQKHKPLYYAKTDTAGRYKISNVKEGKYFMYALVEDKKKNLIYDDSKEKIGFREDTLVITNSSFPFENFSLINYDFKSLKITSKRPRKQYFEVKANKKLTTAYAEFEDKELVKKVFYHVDNDIVRFYNNTGKEATDTLITYLTVKDSVGSLLKDTLKLRFEAVKPKEKKAAKLSITTFPSSNQQFSKGENITLSFNFSVPVATVNVDSMFLQVNKDTVNLVAEDFEFDSMQMKLFYRKPIKITEKVVFKAKPRTFISIENDTLKDVQELTYGIKKADDFAKLSGIVRTSHPHFILQLLNEKNEVEKEVKDTREFVFEYVTPGKKSFRLIIDSNGNGIWDAGNFAKRQKPEQMLFFTEERLEKVAPNWEYEDIIIEEKEE